MVKVFPNNFSFIEKQRLLTSVPNEPVAIACSDEYLFVAEEGCLLEAFSLATLQPLGQFRTVSPVRDLVYNSKGDCVITLERKSAVSHGFARVYFKWKGASVDKPMRISLLSSLSQTTEVWHPQDHVAAEIIELPGELNSPVTCLACCPESGRIAVGMDTTLRIFTLTAVSRGGGGVSSEEGSMSELSGVSHDSSSHLSHTIDVLMDIHTSTPLHKLAIFSDYVAFISSHEARVLKLSLLRDTDLQSQQLPFVTAAEEYSTSCSSSLASSPATRPSSAPRHPKVTKAECTAEDKDYVKWSPSRVWEEEKAVNSSPVSTSSSLVDVSLPVLSRNRSLDSRGPSPIIGTLSLPSVCNSTSHKVPDKHATEVLGPVEYIWGQPVRVSIEDTGSNATPTRCRVLTMLYRRFPPVKTAVSHADRSATLPAKERRVQSSEDGVGLHTVQLLPVVLPDENGSRQLIGISCFLADKFHGYLYDVHLQGHLASSFSFMSPARGVVCDDMFLHALSAESVETYTSRSLQATIMHLPSKDLLPNFEWLQKPSPPPSMDLTLVSANQFVSSYCLASSRDHMIVLTKSAEQPQSTASWLLPSLSPKKAPELSWNIYILQKKDTLAMFQQFGELSTSLQDTSPPMYHHLLCEGHNLLRSRLLLGPALSTQQASDLISSLQANCQAMAESLCHYNTGKRDITAAAKYLILSRQRIWTLIQTICNKFARKPSPPYTILLKFLELVLYDDKFSDGSMESAEAADAVLQLYADFSLLLLPHVLLDSWLDHSFTPGKALQAVALYLQSKSLNANQIFLGKLCELLFLLRLKHQQEAVSKLRELTNPFFSEWLGNNLHYLVERGHHLTELGKLLLEHRVNCLLEVLYNSLSSGTFELELTCKLLQNTDGAAAPTREQLATNLPLKHFLDGLFLDKAKGLTPDTAQKAQVLLADVLVARLTVTTHPPSSSTPFQLYGSRHKWLDSLPPFDGPSPKPSQVMLQDLMQLQSLLCSTQQGHVTSSGDQQGHVTSSGGHMTAVASHVEGCIHDNNEIVGDLSLKLLTWPHTGKMKQAVKLVFECCPVLTVEYCESYLPPQLSHWKELLDLLLSSCNIATADTPSSSLLLPPSGHTHHDHSDISADSLDPPLHTYLSLYRAALAHVVGLCSPQEFLDLLPAAGAVSFFLPYIERSCKLHLSRQLAQHLLTAKS